MEAYSSDLRMRVIRSYDKGDMTQDQLAERFEVSRRWIQKLLCQRREGRSIDPLPWNGGRRRKVDESKAVLLKQAVAQCPDASLVELRDACAVDGSPMCVFRALERLGITRKKRR